MVQTISIILLYISLNNTFALHPNNSISTSKCISLTLNWYDAYLNNKNDLKKVTELQIDEYLNIVK